MQRKGKIVSQNFAFICLAKKCEISWKKFEIKKLQNTSSSPLVFAKTIFAKFRFVLNFSASFIFVKKCEISRKSLRNTNENFRIFSRNVSFSANPNHMLICVKIRNNYFWTTFYHTFNTFLKSQTIIQPLKIGV